MTDMASSGFTKRVDHDLGHRPSDELLFATVRTYSAKQAWTVLRQQGFTVTRDECEMLRRRFDAEAGRVRRPPQQQPAFRTDPMLHAERDCGRLEVAICDLYARVAAERQCSFRTASDVLNYSPEYIAYCHAKAVARAAA